MLLPTKVRSVWKFPSLGEMPVYTATWSMVMRLNAFFCGTVELARLRLGPKSKLIRGQIPNISLSEFARITYLQPDEACQISYLGYGD